jgi:hypothetical protein
MVVDYKLFSPGAELPPGVLYVSEQIPGLVVFGDITQELGKCGVWFPRLPPVHHGLGCRILPVERGYFPSYNVPYFPIIYQKSGYPSMTERFRNRTEDYSMALAGLSYQLCPRAMIFRRDQGTVVDMNSFKTILRSNNYKNDPYAKGSPYGAICSRGDLAGDTGGCYDTKVTSDKWLTIERADVINGPTTAGMGALSLLHGLCPMTSDVSCWDGNAGGTLPPFQWTSQFDSTAHEGQPNVYNFAFEVGAFRCCCYRIRVRSCRDRPPDHDAQPESVKASFFLSLRRRR